MGSWVGRGFPRPGGQVSLDGGRGVIGPWEQRGFLVYWATCVGISLAGAACLGISQYLLGEERCLRLGKEGEPFPLPLAAPQWFPPPYHWFWAFLVLSGLPSDLGEKQAWVVFCC